MTAEGWIFGGWYLDAACTQKATAGATITADTTLYAKWTEKAANTYTITYNTQGHGEEQNSVANVVAIPSSLPELTAEGWTFGGWYTDEACTVAAVKGATITADTTLYAKWTKNAPKPVTPEPTPKKDNTGLIVGLVVGGVVLLGAAGGFTFYLTKKGKTSKKHDVENKE